MQSSQGKPEAGRLQSFDTPPPEDAAAVQRALWVLLGTLAIGLVVAAFIGPVPQDPAYHFFADRRVIIGVPFLMDVLSNLPFVLVGGMSLGFVVAVEPSPGGPYRTASERVAILVFCLGAILTGFGSSYYHLQPSNDRLLWDRLPMTLCFMSLLALVIRERLSVRWGDRLLLPLVVLGMFSVFYWHWGEQRGTGDLRLYAIVQFYPLLAIPLLLWLRPARYTRSYELFVAVGWYALAKVAEALDATIYGLGQLISGHTIKHILAAVAIWSIAAMLTRRVPLESTMEAGEAEGQGDGPAPA